MKIQKWIKMKHSVVVKVTASRTIWMVICHLSTYAKHYHYTVYYYEEEYVVSSLLSCSTQYSIQVWHRKLSWTSLSTISHNCFMESNLCYMCLVFLQSYFLLVLCNYTWSAYHVSISELDYLKISWFVSIDVTGGTPQLPFHVWFCLHHFFKVGLIKTLLYLFVAGSETNGIQNVLVSQMLSVVNWLWINMVWLS